MNLTKCCCLHLHDPPITHDCAGANIRNAKLEDAGLILADTLRGYMQEMNVADGLKALGYSSADIPALVKGTLPQVNKTFKYHESFFKFCS